MKSNLDRIAPFGGEKTLEDRPLIAEPVVGSYSDKSKIAIAGTPVALYQVFDSITDLNSIMRKIENIHQDVAVRLTVGTDSDETYTLTDNLQRALGAAAQIRGRLLNTTVYVSSPLLRPREPKC